MNNAIFLGEQLSNVSSVPSVWVARPTPAHRRSLVPWVSYALGAVAAILVLGATGAVGGLNRTIGSVVLAAVCIAAPVLFYRNTKLFVTDQHFGSTNLFGSMKLIPRKLLASVEAGREFRFRSADGVTLLAVRPSVWRTSQIRQLSARLGVPFEVSVGR